MSNPRQFGRIADNAGNGTPVVRSARIKALVAQQLAQETTTTTAPDAVEAPNSSEGSAVIPPVSEPKSDARKRSHDPLPSDGKSVADSGENNNESADAQRPHKKRKPQTDGTEEIVDIQSPNEIRSMANEERIEPSPQVGEVAGLAESRFLVDEARGEPKSQPDQVEEEDDIQGPTETESLTKDKPVNSERSLPEAGQSFYHAIIAAILWLRVLDQQRAAQKECSSKISILHRLMNLKKPSMVSAPIDDEYQDSREKLRSDFERYERNLETRSAQAETASRDIPHLVESSKARMDRFDDFVGTSSTLPDVACLRDSAEFQAIFERCRFDCRNLSDIEDEISDEEREIDLAHDRIDAYASRLATRGLEVAGLTAARKPTIPAAESMDSEYSPAQEFQENISTRLSKRQELKAELQKIEQNYFEHKENLAKMAEKLLIEAGMLEPGTPHVENPAPAPNAGKLPDVAGADGGNHVENAEGRPNEEEEGNVFGKRQAQHYALIAELMTAQHHLCDAEKAFQNSRKFTEEELAKLPIAITEDEFGRELARKLTRTTRNYIDAQKRVVDAQAEGRRLRVPAVDRYPIGQTWDFEDRTDDGYLDSVFVNKVERSKPKVEEWLPQIAMSGKPLSPPTRRKMPKTVRNLAALRLGDDNVEGFSSDGGKERIARYQKACEDLRRERLFPISLPDTFVEGEQSRHLNSHMI